MAYTGIIKNNGSSAVTFTAVVAGRSKAITLQGGASLYTEMDAGGADFVALAKARMLSVTGDLQRLVRAGGTTPAPASTPAAALPPVPPAIVDRLAYSFKKRGEAVLPEELRGVTSGAFRVSANGLEILDTATNTWKLITFVDGELTFTQV